MHAIIINYKDDFFDPQGVALVNDDEVTSAVEKIQGSDMPHELFMLKTLKVDSVDDIAKFVHNQNQ